MGWDSGTGWGGEGGDLVEATISFLEGKQVVKAQGFLESSWYFSLT